ncbi:MAG: VanZ family protein [Solirubrobacterales bacterium]|nr:VanZ family protein [Solirubrobacterales bacterium]
MSGEVRPSASRLLAPLALMALIFMLSAETSDTPDREWWDVVLRKLAHFSEYAVLTALWWWALVGRVRHPLALAAGIALAWSCSDEFHQTFVQGRQGTPRDLLIDATGIATAAYVLRRISSGVATRRDKPRDRAGGATPRSNRDPSR